MRSEKGGKDDNGIFQQKLSAQQKKAEDFNRNKTRARQKSKGLTALCRILYLPIYCYFNYVTLYFILKNSLKHSLKHNIKICQTNKITKYAKANKYPAKNVFFSFKGGKFGNYNITF